jgi:CRISPR-associated exonuclease Cas4
VFSEDDLLPLSGLQHLAFCERRWALVQLEGIWSDNRFTAEGRELHEKAHSGEIESRPGVLIRRTVPIQSLRLGLSGEADIVEFQPIEGNQEGIVMAGRRGRWRPFPIEYKRSRDKARSKAYQVQLCAQGLCLEEMLGATVESGAVYDGSTRRRIAVAFTRELRELVEYLAARMHQLFAARSTPLPILTKACGSCSLREDCHPEALSQRPSVEIYLQQGIRK